MKGKWREDISISLHAPFWKRTVNYSACYHETNTRHCIVVWLYFSQFFPFHFRQTIALQLACSQLLPNSKFARISQYVTWLKNLERLHIWVVVCCLVGWLVGWSQAIKPCSRDGQSIKCWNIGLMEWWDDVIMEWWNGGMVKLWNADFERKSHNWNVNKTKSLTNKKNPKYEGVCFR